MRLEPLQCYFATYFESCVRANCISIYFDDQDSHDRLGSVATFEHGSAIQRGKHTKMQAARSMGMELFICAYNTCVVSVNGLQALKIATPPSIGSTEDCVRHAAWERYRVPYEQKWHSLCRGVAKVENRNATEHGKQKNVSATEHGNANPSPHEQNKHSGSGGVEKVENGNAAEGEKHKTK